MLQKFKPASKPAAPPHALMPLEHNWREVAMVTAPSRMIPVSSPSDISRGVISPKDKELIKITTDLENWNELRMLKGTSSSAFVIAKTSPPVSPNMLVNPNASTSTSHKTQLPAAAPGLKDMHLPTYKDPAIAAKAQKAVQAVVMSPQQKVEMLNGNVW